MTDILIALAAVSALAGLYALGHWTFRDWLDAE